MDILINIESIESGLFGKFYAKLTHFVVDFVSALRCHSERILFCVTSAPADPDAESVVDDRRRPAAVAADGAGTEFVVAVVVMVVCNVAVAGKHSRPYCPAQRMRVTGDRQFFAEY